MPRFSRVAIVGLAFLALACGRKERVYVPVAGIPANGGAGIACGGAFPGFNVPCGANAKSIVYEIINKGTCPITVTVTPPGAAAIATPVPVGAQVVQALRPVPGQNLAFALTCGTGETNCNFDLKVAEEQEVNAPAAQPQPTFALTRPPALTVPTNQANKCATPDADRKPILTVKNSSNQRQRVQYTVKSTCECPAFVVGNTTCAKNEQKNGFTQVPAGRTITLQAFCTGANVNNSACTGEVTAVSVVPDP